MNLFLDANILLDFYKISNAKLAWLEELMLLRDKSLIRVFITEQVRDEVRRNRERTIKTALSGFVGLDAGAALPAMVREMESGRALTDLGKQYKQLRDALLAEVRSMVASHSLSADKSLAALFQSATSIARTSSTIDKATLRHRLGNPPGKKDSLGDAVNWEACLVAVPFGEDLHLISADGDYYHPIIKGKPYPFLEDEYFEKLGGTLFVYQNLDEFLKQHSASLNDKARLTVCPAAQKLMESLSYATTHIAVKELLGEPSFSESTARVIADAFIVNNQVRDIALDEDVSALIVRMTKQHSGDLAPAQKKAFFCSVPPELWLSTAGSPPL